MVVKLYKYRNYDKKQYIHLFLQRVKLIKLGTVKKARGLLGRIGVRKSTLPLGTYKSKLNHVDGGEK